MRYCKGCGGEFYQGEKICPYCGTNLMTGAPPSPESEPEPEPRSRWDFSRAQEAFRWGQREYDAYRSKQREYDSYRRAAQDYARPDGPPPLHMFRPQRRNAILQAVLAICFGSFGAQWFYRGRFARGLLCLLFCWTGIPGVLGVIEGVGLLRRTLLGGPYLP